MQRLALCLHYSRKLASYASSLESSVLVPWPANGLCTRQLATVSSLTCFSPSLFVPSIFAVLVLAEATCYE
jgi:hypothetical protein